MKNITEVLKIFSGDLKVFPAKWISEHPDKVEAALAELSVEDQIRYAVQLKGAQMQDFINLSPYSQQVVRGLPPEELYQMIKETGLGESLPILAMMSQGQLQYSFDLEWWQRDRFVPECALEWLEFLDACEKFNILEWLQNEDFDQKVVLFQSLIKVFKDDEMTNSYEGVEDMAHLSLDGVYDIYFKTEKYESLQRLLTLLRSEDQTLYASILEAVIWYPVTQTVEKAYQSRLNRTAERGIPDFKEAMGIYSLPSPNTLKIPIPELEDFAYQGEFNIAPTYPLLLTESVPFLKEVFLRLGNSSRLNTISWELIYLANKAMVADQVKPSDLEMRKESLQKVLGYINIGLELGACSDLKKGANLLSCTHILSLFQAGYQQLMNVKWKTENFLKENGSFLECMLTEFHKDLLAALLDRFPRVAEVEVEKSFSWRHFTSLQDVRNAELFLDQWMFNLRFARKGLGLSEHTAKQYLDTCDVPEKQEAVDLNTWTTNAFAHYILFKKISCAPLSGSAAKSFLEIVFLPGIFKNEVSQCDDTLVESFKQELLKLPLAWTEKDQGFLTILLNACILHLQQEFGCLNLKNQIDWKFTRGLCIIKENHLH
jgi:hypothetical protein